MTVRKGNLFRIGIDRVNVSVEKDGNVVLEVPLLVVQGELLALHFASQVTGEAHAKVRQIGFFRY